MDEGTRIATAGASSGGTSFVRTVSRNTFAACDAEITYTPTPDVYDFRCRNQEDFKRLSYLMSRTCFEGEPVVGTYGSLFQRCVSDRVGTPFSSWEPEVNLVGRDPPPSSVLAVLNSPKGLFCACGSSLIDGYVLPFVEAAKVIAVCVMIFFYLVFVAGTVQVTLRCCCPSGKPTGMQGDEGEKMNSRVLGMGMIAHAANPLD